MSFRSLPFLLATVVAVAGLGGCGDGGTPSSDAQTTTPAATTVVEAATTTSTTPAAAHTPAPAGSSAVAITGPSNGTEVSPQWLGNIWAVPMILTGTADVGSTVSVSTPCAVGTGTGSGVTNAEGVWSARIDAVLKVDTPSMHVEATSGSATTAADFPVVKAATAAPKAPRAVLIGDSIGVLTEQALPKALPGYGVSTEAFGGRKLAEGLAIFDHMPLDDPDLKVVMMGLFTNDAPGDTDRLQAAVEDTLERAGPKRCVIWVTISEPPIQGVSYDAANALLVQLADQSAVQGRLIIADWAKTVADTPTLLESDRVHPNESGISARAALLADAVARCRN